MRHSTHRVLVLIGILIMGWGASAYAQAIKTAYEKRTYEIAEKYLAISMDCYKKTLTSQEKKDLKEAKRQLREASKTMDLRAYLMSVAILGYASTHTPEESAKFVDDMSKEFKEAEKLITEEDRRRIAAREKDPLAAGVLGLDGQDMDAANKANVEKPTEENIEEPVEEEKPAPKAEQKKPEKKKKGKKGRKKEVSDDDVDAAVDSAASQVKKVFRIFRRP